LGLRIGFAVVLVLLLMVVNFQSWLSRSFILMALRAHWRNRLDAILRQPAERAR